MAWPSEQPAQPKGKLPPIGPGVIILSLIAIAILVYSWQEGRLGPFQVFLFIALVPSVVLHEVNHGFLAHLYGDDTAKRAGRLTLNPLRHVDPWMTFIIPAILILAAGFAIGGAKPVPVNTNGMSRNKTMFVGLVGPVVNIVLALIAALVFIALFNADPVGVLLSEESLTNLPLFVLAFGYINVVLAIFNLLPIPPLDGASVVERFLPERYWAGYLKFRQYSFFLLLAIMLFGLPYVQRYIISPLLGLWLELLPVGVSFI